MVRGCLFRQIVLNWNISVINKAKFIKFPKLVAGGHSEGTMSQICYLGPSFHFTKPRKFSFKKWQKNITHDLNKKSETQFPP